MHGERGFRMRFDILTLFPEMFEATLDNSIIGRAKNKGLVEINYIQIRDFSKNKHRKVDDYPYGGGQGMVMQAQPIFDAYMSVADGLGYKPYTIYMSPRESSSGSRRLRGLPKRSI